MLSNSLLIKKSHERCENYGLPREIIHSKKILKDSEVRKILNRNRELIEISKIYIEMVSSTLEYKDFIIILTDNNGCILYIDGDEKVIEKFSKLNIIVGAFMDEKNIGTNAMGIALKEDKPVQITANEHYIDIFKKLTCSAAPIHNHNKKIIGTLNITGESNKRHAHTLGLVIFGVKAIENEILKYRINNILQYTYNCMESVIDNVDKGIVIVDMLGKIKNINEIGAKIFLGEKKTLINKDIKYMFFHWDDLLERLEEEKCLKEEILLKDAENIRFLAKIKAIKTKDKIIGLIIIIKDKSVLKKLNNTGAFYTLDNIVSESHLMINIIKNAKLVASSPSTILIEGESGTGKEIIAQGIHNYSQRKNNKFIAINCGAIPNNIIESELFGYEDGTFTGGKKGGKPGKLEMANRGTLFLDEVGEMPMDVQVKLLRVLQEKRVTRLGGNKEIPIDVRIIAATNRDLQIEIDKGNFRKDLYYRLCVIPIRLPSLRERKEDIKLLISHFLKSKSFELNKKIPSINESLYNNFINYSWPGNVRQLENYIENLVNLDGEISEIFLKNIEEEIKNRELKSLKVIESDVGDIFIKTKAIDFDLENMEKQLIRKALSIFENNMSKTAKSLGISRNTLYAKIKKYQL